MYKSIKSRHKKHNKFVVKKLGKRKKRKIDRKAKRKIIRPNAHTSAEIQANKRKKEIFHS